jgi:hypothetical protein
MLKAGFEFAGIDEDGTACIGRGKPGNLERIADSIMPDLKFKNRVNSNTSDRALGSRCLRAFGAYIYGVE